MLPTKFHIIWPSGFRGKAVLEIDQSEIRIAYGVMFVNGSKRNEQFP
jgi:hypothetical protein